MIWNRTRKWGAPLLLILMISFLPGARADEAKGPFRRTSDVTLHRTVRTWLDHFTVGGVNTVIGGGNVLIALIARAVTGEGIRMSVSDSNHGQQVLVKGGSLNWGFDYSLGLFNNGAHAIAAKHEAGHSQQSSTVGPIYLPLVGLDYLIEGNRSGNFVETWANIEARVYDDHSITFPVQVGTGVLDVGGKTVPYLLIRASIDERVDDERRGTRLQKIHEWLRTEITVPAAREGYEESGEIPVGFEIDLLRKTVWAGTHIVSNRLHALDFEVHTRQNYGRAIHTPMLNILHYNALRWASELGLTYEYDDIVRVALSAGGGLSGDGFVATADGSLFDEGEHGFHLGGSVNGSLRVTILEYLTIYGAIEQYWLVNYFKRASIEAGITNSFRLTSNGVPDLLNHLDFTARYRFEEWTLGGGRRESVHRADLMGGFRF